MQGLVQDAGQGQGAPCSPQRTPEGPSHAASSIARRLRPHDMGPAAPPRSTQRSTQRTPQLPEPTVETYTAHSTVIPAVKFNKVYPTPCTAVPSISVGRASDKRCSLGGMAAAGKLIAQQFFRGAAHARGALARGLLAHGAGRGFCRSLFGAGRRRLMLTVGRIRFCPARARRPAAWKRAPGRRP